MAWQPLLHFIKDCPHAYENIKQKFMTWAEEFPLFTAKSNNELTVLLTEAGNSAVLDNPSSSIVAGKDWVDCYVDSLNNEEKKLSCS